MAVNAQGLTHDKTRLETEGDVSEEQAERLISALKNIGASLGWIGFWMFWLFMGGCNGCFHLANN